MAANLNPKKKQITSNNTIMDNNLETPKIGPYTSNLLRALQAYAQAVNYYFLAVTSMRNIPGEEAGLTDEEHQVFDKCRQLLEDQIMISIRDWANSTDTNIEL